VAVRIIENYRSKYRYSLILLRELVITDFKLRYQGSILGYLWSLLKPLALFTILYFVFVKFLKFGGDIPHYSVYLLLGIVLWSFFAEVTNSGLGSIVGRGDLLRKLNFPRYVIVLSTAFSALINLGINMIVVVIFMIINGVGFSFSALWSIVFIVELFILALSLAVILSALFVKYRDMSHIWEVVMQGLFYATPIIYPLSMISTKYAQIILINPLAQIIQDIRYYVISDQTITAQSLDSPIIIRLLPFIIVLVLTIISVLYFKKRAKYFAEEI
jgi:ABC-2 type transport system permease protein